MESSSWVWQRFIQVDIDRNIFVRTVIAALFSRFCLRPPAAKTSRIVAAPLLRLVPNLSSILPEIQT